MVNRHAFFPVAVEADAKYKLVSLFFPNVLLLQMSENSLIFKGFPHPSAATVQHKEIFKKLFHLPCFFRSFSLICFLVLEKSFPFIL
jgi:hypothetical protein